MALKKPSRGRLIISGGILATMASGLFGWAATEIKKIPVLEEKVKNIEGVNDSIEKKVDEIHWYLIRRKKK